MAADAAAANNEVVVAGAAMKKNMILERLTKRNKDRKNYLDVKLEQRNKENLQTEGVTIFCETFADRVSKIDARIKNIVEVATKKKCSGGDVSAASVNADLLRLFADITDDLQDLQRYLNNATRFLTNHDVKTCQHELNELTNCCEETRQRLVPKKKFGFSGKKVTTKTIVNPKLSMQSKETRIEENLKAVGEAAVQPLNSSAAPMAPSSMFAWTVANRRHEHIMLQGDDDVNGKDITITNISDCIVELRGHAGSLQISNAHGCIILCGPVARSVFAENCKACKFALSCQQLRLHSSQKLQIFLHVTCRAIIEDSTHIYIGPYNYRYVGIDRDFELANLDAKQNNYKDVADFNWLSPDVPSPNWHLLSPEVVGTIDWCAKVTHFRTSLSNEETPTPKIT